MIKRGKNNKKLQEKIPFVKWQNGKLKIDKKIIIFDDLECKISGKRCITLDYMLAFIVGGLICVIVQILMDNTNLLPGRILLLLVCSGAVLGAVCVY